MPSSPKRIDRPWINKPEEKQNWSDNDIYHKGAWKKDSEAHLRANPLCEICKSMGRVTPAEVSDHRKEISQGGDMWDWNNRQALCKRCHNRKTQLNKKRT